MPNARSPLVGPPIEPLMPRGFPVKLKLRLEQSAQSALEGDQVKGRVSSAAKPPPMKSKSGAAAAGRAAGVRTRTTRSVQRVGAGLSTMRQHKVRTGMIVGAGMGVAAAMRSTGSGSAASSQSLYRY